MKKYISLIIIFVMAFVTHGFTCKTYAAETMKSADNAKTTVIIEAEDMVLGKNAVIKEQKSASGGKAVEIFADTKNSIADDIPNPTLSKDIELETAGVYSLWARVIAPNSESDEIFYSYTGSNVYDTIAFENSTDFVWKKVCEITLINGILTIDFKYKEPNLLIDKFILTADTDFLPSSAESVPSDSNIKRIYPLPSVKPIDEHPRLFATADIVAELLENTKSPELNVMYNQVRTYAFNEPLNTILPETLKDGTNYDATITRGLQSRAYMRLLNQVDAEHSKRTIKYMKELLATVKWDTSYSDITRKMGDVILTGALVYDWCYDEMTEADKEFFIAYFKKISFTKEIGYPPTKKYAFAGHGAEREIMCDLFSAGIACYDEDTEIYDLAAGRFFDEYVGSRKVFNKTGSHPVGSSYGHYRYTWELCAAAIYDRMGYKNIMGEEISSVAYRYLYQRLPFGLWVKDNDDYIYGANKYFQYNSNDALCYLLASYLSDDEYLKGEWLKHFSINNYNYYSQDFYLWALLFDDPGIKGKTPEELPLTYKMNYPLTALTARTSWQMGLDAKTSVIHMKAEEKVLADTAFADLGNFMIYYKGNLLINGGSYGGNKGNWGSPHAMNYEKRTISKNCMTVYDPDEIFNEFHGVLRNPPLANDGGQRVFAPRIENYQDYLKVKDSARTDGMYVGPNEYTPVFSYVKTDLTNAYSDKIEEYSRSMIAINFFDENFPQGFICFDNIKTSNKNFKKTWNLQSVGEPVIDGNKITITRTDNGFGGKLVNRTLLPKSDNIKLMRVGEKIGMPVTYVEGKNYDNPDINGYETEQGDWRVELSPINATQNDLFLNAMYVTDSDNNDELVADYEENESFCGVTLKNAAVYFSKKYNHKQDESFSLTLRDNDFERVSLLVTDIKGGKWKIAGDATELVVDVGNEENALCAVLSPGTYDFVPVGDSEKLSEINYEEVNRKKIGDFHIYDTRNKLFMYQEYETKIIDGIPYIPLRAVLERLGATVSWDGVSVTVAKKKSAVITPGSRDCIIDNMSSKLKYEPLELDSNIYVYPKDFESVVGVTFNYDDTAKILKIQ